MTTSGIRFEHVTKCFPGAMALDDVTFEIVRGSCHALCGENGAGKSTLGRILAGIQAPDAGRVLLDGEPVRLSTPAHARAAGIAMVHQELSFCDNLTVAENLILGNLPARAGFLSKSRMRKAAEERLAAIGSDLDVGATVSALTTGQQQMLQIAAAVGGGARVIVFDEPTSSLSQHEADRLYRVMATLRGQGVTCIYVSHRLEEIFRLCDAVTVLRDGRHVGTGPTAALDQPTLIQMMIGRRLDEYFPSHVTAEPGPELLRVEALSGSRFKDVSFTLRAGEILGFAGLVGAGRSEVVRAVFGVDPRLSGSMWVRGARVAPAGAQEAVALGIGLVPEDRKRQGLVLPMSARANGALAVLRRLSRLGWLTRAAEQQAVGPFVSRLRLRPGQMQGPVAALSGGNQQKVVLMKWLAARCPILIVDEPTRGVDVGAKAEIHALIDELAAAGTAIILVSSDMPELLNLSTRLLVFRGGRVVGEVPRTEATQEHLMRLMAGVAA